MEKTFDENKKAELITALVDNLPVLRAKLGLSQEELAIKIGVTRQTIINIEKKKIKLGWTTALALLMLFTFNPLSAVLLTPLGILTNNVYNLIGTVGSSTLVAKLLAVFNDNKTSRK